MVAITARCVDPARATPFADAALVQRSHGLAPIPLGGDKGQATLIKWKTWKRLPHSRSLERLVVRFPAANVGVLTGLSGVTIVDVDDPDLLDAMIRRFGDTPLITGTPRGGFHLWYKSSGERCLTGLDGVKVDIKGIGGMVVVPPSIRPTGEHAGQAYTFVNGSWDDLNRLPTIEPGALDVGVKAGVDHPEAVLEGRRNRSLFLACLDQAPYCGAEERQGVSVDLLDVAQTLNADYLPPLSDAEVLRVARSAWRRETRGENWRGYRGHGAHVRLDARVVARLAAEYPKHGPDALMLYVTLREKHGARAGRGETFAVAARAMAHQVLPWPEYRIRQATRTLVAFGLLERVHKGGKSPGDAAQYTFRSPPPALVSKMNTNVIVHPAPLLLRGMRA